MLKVVLRKSLPNLEIDIAFSCPDGGLLALVGPSGSGKTTICRMVAGLDRPDEGVIICGEETWCDTHAHKWIRVQERGIGFLFQDYTLFPHMSVWENIKFATKDLSLSQRLLYLLGIEHLKDRRPCSISGGERQRAALAQALSRRPKVLILDEPFSALDHATRSSLRRLILDIKKRFCLPIIFVTHDLYDAYALADEIVPVSHGRHAPEWLAGVEASLLGAPPVIRLEADQSKARDSLNGVSF